MREPCLFSVFLYNLYVDAEAKQGGGVPQN